jgi:hypothetical protein
MKSLRFIFLVLASGSLVFLASCSKDDPKPENIKEAITKATFTFTPVTGSPVVVNVTDPDGTDGPINRVISGPINLVKNMPYTLTITMINELAPTTAPEYNVTDEVEEEADEHMFFFAWTNNTFSNPAGNGNIDARADLVNYNDKDTKNLPLGLSTAWTTIDVAASGKFRIVLKHQPDLKSATSTFSDGDSDLDVEFDLNVN